MNKKQKALDKACRNLLAAGYEFFKTQEEALKSSAAVKWVEFENGEVVIFTRGEYRNKIMNAVNENEGEVYCFKQQEEDRK